MSNGRWGCHVIWCVKLHVYVMAMLAASKLMQVGSKAAHAPLMPILNSPAAKVKEGRQRGPSVLETLRKQEQAQEEARRKKSAALLSARGAHSLNGGVSDGTDDEDSEAWQRRQEQKEQRAKQRADIRRRRERDLQQAQQRGRQKRQQSFAAASTPASFSFERLAALFMILLM